MMSYRFPALFVSHGAPGVALENSDYTRALAAFGRELRPRTVVVVSAHWEESTPVRVTGSPQTTIQHDFSGFPAELYRLRYPAPGDPDLSAEIVRLLERNGLRAVLDPARPLDHGVWVPLQFLYPEADVPVVSVSLPEPRTAQTVAQMGAALSPLRDRDTLLLGSGGIVHNLRRLRFGEKEAPADDWARAFDDWVAERLASHEFERIFAYRQEAPGADLAVPSTEHFDPLFFVLGAAQGPERARTLHAGIEYGNLSLRTFALGEGPPAPVRPSEDR